MPTAGQIRGMLLEEVILRALEVAGYDTVLSPDGQLIQGGGAGLELEGRGTRHQIDAIADYRFQQPFSHPQRLLLEAKCYWDGVRLEVIRNAVGVHKDVSEYWNQKHTNEQRFHYQYAVFSANRFSKEAEAYAFAQDIYLFPLGRSHFFRPVLNAIWRVKARLLGQSSFKELRRVFRGAIRTPGDDIVDHDWQPEDGGVFPEGILRDVIVTARDLKGVLFATSRSGFLIMLVPNPDRELQDLLVQAMQLPIRIRVRRVMRGWFWYLESQEGEKLFTLDIPPELFRRYALDETSLDRRMLAHAKQRELSVLQVPYQIGERVGIAQINLDQDWIEQVRRNLDGPNASPD
jgi:hypothetical protein